MVLHIHCGYSTSCAGSIARKNDHLLAHLSLVLKPKNMKLQTFPTTRLIHPGDTGQLHAVK